MFRPGRGRGCVRAAFLYPLELALQVRDALPAVVRVLGQAFFYNPTDRGWNHRLIHGDRLWLAVEDGGDQGRFVLGGEGSLAGEDFVEYAAEGENIGARVGGLALQLLGSHVLEGADDGPLFGERPGLRFLAARVFYRIDFREAEVQDFDAGFGGEDVGRFEIAMRDRLSMRGLERAG